MLIAAAAHLALMKNKDSFSRQELLVEMKSATGFYKKNYSSNLTSYINTANGDALAETATGVFSLSEKTHKSVETALAHD